jgi:hypothetical protein
MSGMKWNWKSKWKNRADTKRIRWCKWKEDERQMGLNVYSSEGIRVSQGAKDKENKEERREQRRTKRTKKNKETKKATLPLSFWPIKESCMNERTQLENSKVVNNLFFCLQINYFLPIFYR